jgi:rRNA-processing protein EBP2
MLGNTEEEDVSLMSDEVEDFEEDDTVLKKGVPREDAKNDEAGLNSKCSEIKLRIPGEATVPWIETLVVGIGKIEIPNGGDDLEREKKFYDAARKGVLMGMATLKALDIPRDRPDDFFAEMIKEDKHMVKVKRFLLREKKGIDDAQLRTKKRIETKFARSAQASSVEQKSKDKKEETEALRKWRKLKRKNQADGDEEFPEELLDPNSQLRKQLAGYGSAKKSFQRGGSKGGSDKKFGGKRSRSNSFSGNKSPGGGNNNRNRSSSFSGGKSSDGKPSGRRGGGGGGSSGKKNKGPNRPGKRKRQQARASQASKSRSKKRK